MSLILQSGMMEDIQEWSEGTIEAGDYTAYCEVTRKGFSPHIASFSLEDARTARLWEKKGPWQNYPKRMMKLRARMEAIRDRFADAMRGLAFREETQDYQDAQPRAALTLDDVADKMTGDAEKEGGHE